MGSHGHGFSVGCSCGHHMGFIWARYVGSCEQKFSVGFPLQVHYMPFRRFSDMIDFKWVVHVGTTWNLDGLCGLTYMGMRFLWAAHVGTTWDLCGLGGLT